MSRPRGHNPLLWGAKAAPAIPPCLMAVSLYPRQPLINQAWVNHITPMLFLCSYSSIAHPSSSFCFQVSQGQSTMFPRATTALQMLPGRKLPSNQTGLELTCLRLVCLVHSSDFETTSVHMRTVLFTAAMPMIHRNHRVGIAHHLTLVLHHKVNGTATHLTSMI